MLDKLKPYAKAIVAFIAPGVPLLSVALEDGKVTLPEALAILGAMLGTGGLVYLTPNETAEVSADERPDTGV